MLTHLNSEEAAGFVLAGGRSSRMGSDKALSLFAGRPLVAIAVDTLAAAGLSAQIAGSRSPLSVYAPEIADTWKTGSGAAGPLAGVHAALSVSHADWNVFLAVDSPLLPASLLRCLLERAILTDSPVSVALLNGRLQPFPVVLRRSSLRVVEALLERGEYACHAAWRSICSQQNEPIQSVAVENLIQCASLSHPLRLPPASWFQSANTPSELRWLNQLQHFRLNPIL